MAFPDGYASNLRNFVDKSEGKFTGLKSHICHVMMQRLLPFAFSELLPRNVHEFFTFSVGCHIYLCLNIYKCTYEFSFFLSV